MKKKEECGEVEGKNVKELKESGGWKI